MSDNSTLITGIKQKELDGYFQKRDYGNQFYFEKFFPWRWTPSLENSVLVGKQGLNVAADIIAFDSSTPEKKRKVAGKIDFDLAAIRIKRIMSETQINEYFTYKAYANSDAKRRIGEMVYGDVDFAVIGCLARCEWMFGQVLSTGYFNLSTTNNNGVVTQTTIDFGVPAGNREVCSAADQYWTTGAKTTNDPISVIETITAEARESGVRLKYILMNRSKFSAVRASSATIDFVNGQLLIDSGVVQTAMKPSIASLNAALKGAGLPEIVIIDSLITLEDEAHDQTNVDVWEDSSNADRYVTFVPDLNVGNMYYCNTAEELVGKKSAIQSKTNNVLVSRWAEHDPAAEITQGLLNAFPGFARKDEAWFLDTESHTTYGA